MKITVIGSGYVGLVSGVCFAKLGHEVICVDKDEKKISTLKSGAIPIFEPGLSELLSEVKISFTTNLKDGLNGSSVVFIAVGTPQDEDGSADLSYVLAAAKEIAELSDSYKLIVTKSTVPAGTGAKIKALVKQVKPQLDFSVASNPEFLREGVAINDFMHPDRIVVGVEDEKSQKIFEEIYAKFSKEKLVTTDIITAELIKYASNSFLATKISFINEMADLCEEVGGNIKQLSRAVGLDSRIGEKFLNPGPGFGGSCFPKDILAIINVAKENNIELSLIDSVIASNQKRKIRMVEKILSVPAKKIALFGLAFKANTDDIRYSPAITIAKELAKKGVEIRAHDFAAIENAKRELAEFKNISFFEDLYEAATDADSIVIVTEWEEYKKIDFSKIKTKKILDLRNLFDTQEMRKKGFEYHCVGSK